MVEVDAVKVELEISPFATVAALTRIFGRGGLALPVETTDIVATSGYAGTKRR